MRLLPLALLGAVACGDAEDQGPLARAWAQPLPHAPRCFSIANDSVAVVTARGWLTPPAFLRLDSIPTVAGTLDAVKGSRAAMATADSAYPAGWWARDSASDSIAVGFAPGLGLQMVIMIGLFAQDSSLNGYYTGMRDQAEPPRGTFTAQPVRCP